MTVIKLHISMAGAELRAFPKRDREAIVAAARKTIMIDAPRWVQWSIRGGDLIAQARDQRAQVRAKKAALKPERDRAAAQKASARTAKKRVAEMRKAIKEAKNKTDPKAIARAIKAAAKKAADPDGKAAMDKQKVKKKRVKKLKTVELGPKTQAGAYRVPIDTGDYANSWVAESTPNGAVYYSASNPPIKAGVIELGRRPGKGIPTRPLADWVRRKLGVTDEKKARGIAFVISRNAKLFGRPGLHVLRRAHPKIDAALHKNLIRQVRMSHAKAARLYRSTRG